MRLRRLSLFPLSRHRDQWSHVLLRCAEAIYDSAECVRSAAIRAVRKLISDYHNIAATDWLRPADADRLMQPLIDLFKSYRHEYDNCCFSLSLDQLIVY